MKSVRVRKRRVEGGYCRVQAIRYAQDTRASRSAVPVLSPTPYPKEPDNATLLKIYALYKQASAGDNAEKKPSFSDMVGRAKWDAWNKLKGTEQDAARQQYIDLIASLS